MDRQMTAADLEFMRWLDSKEAEPYWERDERGETVILRLGWEKAPQKYNRIKDKLNQS